MKKSIYLECSKKNLIKVLTEVVPDSSVRLYDVLGKILCECDFLVSFHTYTPNSDEELTEVVIEEVRHDDK